MTDIPVPTSGVAKFGVRILGQPFEWDHIVDGQVVTDTFNAKASFSFDSQLEYQAITAMLRSHTFAANRRTQRDLKAAQDPEISDDDLMTLLAESAKQSVEEEKLEWRKVIDQVLLLVEPEDAERLRPLLIESPPQQVRDLRAWLEEKVIGKAEKEVGAVGAVDPTLPSPPAEPSPTPDSGPDSESDPEPSSTA